MSEGQFDILTSATATLSSGQAADENLPSPTDGCHLDHISVCVCTFRRQTGLARLLEAVNTQETAGAFSFSVVIVDNDAAESAKCIFESFAKASALHVDYSCEPEQNIALARNRAVRIACGKYIAFIDDDEWPEKDWLRCMYEVIRKHEADGVLGPVKPVFEREPPEWVVKGRFFDKPGHERLKTGSILGWTDTRTSNALLKKKLFSDANDCFDSRFGLGGGEDVEFFSRKIARGGIFVWCQEAPVFELIPSGRWSRRFLLSRALLRGRMTFLLPTTGFLDVLRSLIAVPLYAAALPAMLCLGQHIFMTYLVKCCDHVGTLLTVCRLNLIEERYVKDR